jgi:hypothetical protein
MAFFFGVAAVPISDGETGSYVRLRKTAKMMILIAGSFVPCLSQSPPPAESRKFAVGCREVADQSKRYLSEHGISTFESGGFDNIEIRGRESEEISAGSLASGVRKLKQWKDGRGKAITDFRVYWEFADRKTVTKAPAGIWRLRLSQYVPGGKIELHPTEGGCELNMKLHFSTNGADMIAILGVDATWAYSSNGRLEREYLDGISSLLVETRTGREAVH